MLVKMGADIQGIGSNLITVNGAERLHGCEHDVAPDHIEIGSFMALAGVTGGELRIKDTVPGDLRMIRLVFERLGLRTELRRQRRARARRPEARRPGGRGRVQEQDPGRAVAGVPGRPDLDRGRAGDAGGGLDPRARVDVREPPDLHRQADPDGRRHRHVRPAPRDRHRPAAAARRARGVARHPRRHGDAAGGAVRRGAQRDRQHPPDRPRLRAHRRAPARARRAHRARGHRAGATSDEPRCGIGAPQAIATVRSMATDDPPDPQRHARRAARRDARGARDHRHPARRVRAARLRRGLHAGARVRVGARAAARTWPRRSPPTACSTSPARCSCCART